MGGEIIAEKFALLKTRGSNGVSFTHIVEDTLLGQRAVVKVSDKLDELGLEYLKAVNLVRESGIKGLLVPFEGGFLEEEAGYYLAFPELGEPSLENYLRLGAPITCGEVLGIGEKILQILEDLHEAGYFHLFINTRNVFYRPRGEVTLKDAALRREWFHPLLELTASPDFSYFSREVMDGDLPGAEADLYALGCLVEKLLECASGAAVFQEEQEARWLAESCRSAGGGDGAASAAEIRRELEALRAKPVEAGGDGFSPSHYYSGEGEENIAGSRSEHGYRKTGTRKKKRSHAAGMALGLIVALFLACGAAAAYLFSLDGDSAPALARAGGSVAGEEAARGSLLEIKEKPAAQEDVFHGGDAPLAEEDTGPYEPAGEAVSAGGHPSTGALETVTVEQPAAAPPAEPSRAEPVASFTLSPAEGLSPLQVYIDASASYDPDGSIVSYAWSCGGSARSFYHVFESNVIPAVIPVTLTVTDDGGHSAQSTLYVTLY